MELRKISLQTLKTLGAVILFSTAVHMTLVFYHLSFGADKVVIQEPNTLLVRMELVLAVVGIIYASYLIIQNVNHLSSQLNQ